VSTDLRARVEAARWYHTIELPGGIVTRGEYDLRPAVAQVPLPSSLAGKRCLDVGTRDGFWAFEMERRGAREVIGIDLDDPSAYDWPEPKPQLDAAARAEIDQRNACFGIARDALGSSVERRVQSVYTLDPETIGRFDFAMIGTLLLHLRDPVGALMGIRRVMEPGGTLLVKDVVSLSLSALRRNSPATAMVTRDEPFWFVTLCSSGAPRTPGCWGARAESRVRQYVARMVNDVFAAPEYV
jgi:tRNA (mo5U34)-methyltransferase